MSEFYKQDEDGNPIPCTMEEAFSKEQTDRKHLHKDIVKGSDGKLYLVSTVFLAIDHSGCLWETGVFMVKDPAMHQAEQLGIARKARYDDSPIDWQEKMMQRYTSRFAADIGHKIVLEAVKTNIEG